MTVKPIPDGYRTVTPYLFIKNAAAALEYYQKAFGATELMRFPDPSGRIGHAEIKIGDSIVMLADEHPAMGVLGPQTVGGTTFCLALYVDDVDAVFRRAIDAGGKEVRPVQDQFYGDRTGTLSDPFGHLWSIATHKEDLSEDEMKQRAQEAAARQQA